MYGFAPGFVFLSGLPDELKIARRASPRPPAPPGALTIANGQALIASIAMPTGWYMLGRTPARTFDPARDPAFPLAVGDLVVFERVDAARFAELEREVAAGRDVLSGGLMPTLTLTSVGPGATVQDGGRRGWLRYGVTPAGPMDWVALETANIALGNAAEVAAIEIGPGGLALAVDAPLPLAFAGGGFAWTRADAPLPAAARIMLKPGEVLRARGGAWGSFAVLAVPGGIDVAPVMGSRATHTRSALGGVEGRALRAGDRFEVAACAPQDDVAIEAPWLVRAATRRSAWCLGRRTIISTPKRSTPFSPRPGRSPRRRTAWPTSSRGRRSPRGRTTSCRTGWRSARSRSPATASRWC